MVVKGNAAVSSLALSNKYIFIYLIINNNAGHIISNVLTTYGVGYTSNLYTCSVLGQHFRWGLQSAIYEIILPYSKTEEYAICMYIYMWIWKKL